MFEALGSGQFGVNGRGNAVRIGYDAATGRYTFTDTRSYIVNGTTTYSGSSVTMGERDRVSTASYFDTYRKRSWGTTDEVALYGNVRDRGTSETPPIVLSYMSFGYWKHTGTLPNSTRQTYFLFGNPTETRPSTGSATYTTMVSADALTFSGPTYQASTAPVKGNATFNVDFGVGSINTLLTLMTATDAPIGSFDGTGLIYANNQFSGNFASKAKDFKTGAFMGGFYGPAAVEMGYAFYLGFSNHDTPIPAADKTTTYINGVVVGTKN